jgi:hypothetical protein
MPPHTSQRRRPLPSHSLHLPILTPTIDRLPVPRQARQALVLWPWHFGHKTLFGIAASSGVFRSGSGKSAEGLRSTPPRSPFKCGPQKERKCLAPNSIYSAPPARHCGESKFQFVMSALRPKADMCSAIRDVR